ncbi:MAG: RIO1 family regulatory kinase/ATPase [Ardenticatenales bacterium]
MFVRDTIDRDDEADGLDGLDTFDNVDAVDNLDNLDNLNRGDDALDLALSEDFLPSDRHGHRTESPRARRKPRVADEVVFASLTDVGGEVADRTMMTYTPARFEEAWLNEALGPFIHAALLTDVLRLVKGGKEANVYLCRAHPNLGVDLVAAKVYRPRQFRNLRNDSLYRQGRSDLGADGKSLVRDRRAQRAIARGTAVGAAMRFDSWLGHEVETLQLLASAGCAVPSLYGSQGHTILMGYVGDERQAAPTLSQVSLEREEATALFAAVLRDIDAMLAVGVVHGDLSAYNILHWEGEATLIDFPQAVDPFENPAARRIFDRDVERVCQYFKAQGVAAAADPAALAEALWARHVTVDVFSEPYHGHAAAFGDEDGERDERW